MQKKISVEEGLVIVWTTVDSGEAARQLAASLLEISLAACVQIDSPIESHYRWVIEQTQ